MKTPIHGQLRFTDSIERNEEGAFLMQEPVKIFYGSFETISAEISCLQCVVLHGVVQNKMRLYVLDSENADSVLVQGIKRDGIEVLSAKSGESINLKILHKRGMIFTTGSLGDSEALEEKFKYICARKKWALFQDAKQHRVTELKRLRLSLKYNLSAILKSNSSRGFEEFVAEIFRRRGYSVYVTPETRDGGKDVVCRKAGEKLNVECKMFAGDAKVGRPIIQNLAGVCAIDGGKGVLVTTGGFTEEAIQFARKSGIELWDREMLSEIVGVEFPENRKRITYTAICQECGEKVEFDLYEMLMVKKCSKNHSVEKTISACDPFLDEQAEN